MAVVSGRVQSVEISETLSSAVVGTAGGPVTVLVEAGNVTGSPAHEEIIATAKKGALLAAVAWGPAVDVVVGDVDPVVIGVTIVGA
ncbi:MAG TPA: hypothetical protein VFC90_07950 [Planctomycetota bacterium]|nr:hypothetical protein [Planctomycetota bacterium]